MLDRFEAVPAVGALDAPRPVAVDDVEPAAPAAVAAVGTATEERWYHTFT
jgi:hypothetical protein